MNKIWQVVFAVIFGIAGAGCCGASDLYYAQSAAGGNTGADCANAYAYNNSTNGLGTSKAWTAGNTLHLCGTFSFAPGPSNLIVAQNSGTSGSPITLKFENNAMLTATYWPGAAINLNGRSYIMVDGGTNGTIQATANGTAFANQVDNGMCINNGTPGSTSTNVTVKNVTCSNLYVDSSPADNGGEDTYGFDLWNVSNLVIQNNTLHDMKWSIRASYAIGNTYSNLTIAGNNFYNMDHGVFISDSSSSGAAIMSGFYIYGNTLGSMANWDNTLNNNHHDWIHLNTNSSSTRFTNFFLYNNYGAGDVGVYNTGGFFSYPASSAAETGIYVFNNVFVNTSASHCWNNGFVSEYGVGSTLVANNTFISNASCADNGLDYNNNSTGLSFKNNILKFASKPNAFIYATAGVSISAMDYNDYYSPGTASWYYSGKWYSTAASWKSGTGYDAASISSIPTLTSAFHLQNQTVSAGWQTGQSLYSICSGQANPGLGALCYDKAGVARPSSGPWDMGAYEDSANAPAAVTGLTATLQNGGGA